MLGAHALRCNACIWVLVHSWSSAGIVPYTIPLQVKRRSHLGSVSGAAGLACQAHRPTRLSWRRAGAWLQPMYFRSKGGGDGCAAA